MFPDPTASPADTIKEVERQLNDANTEEAIAQWSTLFAEDLEMGDFWGNEGVTRTREAVVAWLRETKAALPDLHIEITRLTSEGSRVVEEGVVSGTHTGTPLLGYPASGQGVSWRFMSVKEVSATTGQITTDYACQDERSLEAQLRAHMRSQPQ